ncbi:hypothetical protein PM082_013301 [Marasmius tenuissimus]|nr:hypothetical protein PM082_013301 [Marasmius tenuissimus]
MEIASRHSCSSYRIFMWIRGEGWKAFAVRNYGQNDLIEHETCHLTRRTSRRAGMPEPCRPLSLQAPPELANSA